MKHTTAFLSGTAPARISMLLLGFFVGASAVGADVTLHGLFTDNMVIQRDMPVTVHGKAGAGASISVEFASQAKKTKAGADGRWAVKLDPMPASSEARTLTVHFSGNPEPVVLRNVLVGDVWLCTGQSNMAGSLGSYITFGNGMFREFKDVPGDYRNPNIRLFRCQPAGFDEPQEEPTIDKAFGPAWRECDPEAAKLFSATGYFFGKALQPAIGVPVGLIYATLGGTAAECWISPETLRSTPEAKGYLDAYAVAVKNHPQAMAAWKKSAAEWNAKRKASPQTIDLGRAPQEPIGPTHVKRPSALYHGVICPLARFAIKGAIWYQGEGNSARAREYRAVFPALIQNWRKDWGQGDFPFLFVQLAAYHKAAEQPADPDWAHLREAQLFTWRTVPATGMAVAIDGGLEDNIHPPYKELVGSRLAAAAQKVAYGRDVVFSGPLFRQMRVEGPKAVLAFDHCGSGLEARAVTLNAYGATPYSLPAGELRGFAVCGEDRRFHWAEARITGSDTIEVQSQKVEKPVAVRYAWADFPLCNLYNKEGFAAVPFRTDEFEQGYANKAAGVAIGRPVASLRGNPLTKQKGSWGGLTDGKLVDTGDGAYSTDSGKQFPKHAVIDLGTPHAIECVRVHNSVNGGTRTVEVMASVDGETYSSIGKTVFENYTASIYEAKPGAPCVAREIKVVFHDVHDISFHKQPNGFCFLREVEVIGKAAP